MNAFFDFGNLINWFWGIIGSVTTFVFTLIVSSISSLKMRVYFIKFVSAFSWIYKKNIPQISGAWSAEYKNQIFPEKTGCHHVMLYQFGNKVVGKSIHKQGILIEGRIVCENYFYGSFLDCKAQGSYYGTFQVKIDRNADPSKMIGKWVGYDYVGSDAISHGEWKWNPLVDIRPNNE